MKRELMMYCGVHAHSILALLLERDGEEKIEDWRREMEEALDDWGSRAPLHHQRPSVVASSNGRKVTHRALTSGAALLIWSQHLRRQLAQPLLSFTSDPAWTKASAELHASLKGELAKTKREARRWCSGRYGLSSTTHLPASALRIAVGDYLLTQRLASKPASKRADPRLRRVKPILSGGEERISSAHYAKAIGRSRFAIMVLFRQHDPGAREERIDGVKTWTLPLSSREEIEEKIDRLLLAKAIPTTHPVPPPTGEEAIKLEEEDRFWRSITITKGH
jgi:hypothetical protein